MNLAIKVGRKAIQIDVADLLVLVMKMSKSEAKRLIKQGGVELYVKA